MAKRLGLGIGELGEQTGLATSALRFYERAGLLTPDGRLNGRRFYSSSSAERIALIRLCQDAGFTLSEIRVFVAAGSRREPAWLRLMQGKLVELAASIARAKRAKALIEHALVCRHAELGQCPNFRAAVKARLGREAPPRASMVSQRRRRIDLRGAPRRKI